LCSRAGELVRSLRFISFVFDRPLGDPSARWRVVAGARTLAILGGDHELDAEVVLEREIVLAQVAGVGVRIIRTPIRAPRANAFAERFVRTVRRECLDHVLIYGPRHLERVLRTYVGHYTNERPHRGLRLMTPSGRRSIECAGPTARVLRHDVLGGLIHEYRLAS
jgi:putative transposase